MLVFRGGQDEVEAIKVLGVSALEAKTALVYLLIDVVVFLQKRYDLYRWCEDTFEKGVDELDVLLEQ